MSKNASEWQMMFVPIYRFLPFLVVVLCSAVFASPLPLPHFQTVAPLVAVITIFYWTVYRESFFPYWLAFAVGLFHDAVMGIPVGTSSLIYLLICVLIAWQRHHFAGTHFLGSWMMAAIPLLLADIGYWLVACFLYGAVVSPIGYAMQAMLSWCVYPCFHWFYSHIYHSVTATPSISRTGRNRGER